MTLKFVEYSKNTEKEWDFFVLNNKNTWIDSISHWINFFENKMKYQNYSFMIYEKDKLLGVFPLFLVKSILFGNRLVSGPILDRGGPFIDKETNLTWAEIDKHLEEIAKKTGADYIEIRCPSEKIPGYLKREEYVDFYMDLNKDQEEIWKSLDKKLRNGIRRAKKEITIEKETSFEGLKKFYQIYLKTMRSLGSPPVGFNFFKEIYADMKDGKAFILFSKYKNKRIAGLIVTSFKKEAKYETAVYLPKYRNLQANSLLVLEAIEESEKAGHKKFVFGRTLKDSSVYKFKKRWNAVEIPSTYYYKLLKRKEIPSDIRDSLLAKIAVKIWSYMPLFLSRVFGNYFRKILAM